VKLKGGFYGGTNEQDEAGFKKKDDHLGTDVFA
jgi:hypothetical protein